MAKRQKSSPCKCPICGDKEVRFDRSLSPDYDLFTCVTCGGRFCDPFAAPVPGFYADASDLGSQSRHAGPADWYPQHPTRQSDAFRNGRDRTLLDIGCGNGAFAEFAATAGYEVVGIDVDSVSIEIARSRLIPGATFYCSTLDEFCRSTAQNDHFDVVTMFEMLEHLDRPLDTLIAAKRLLREDGMLIGSLPNIERLLMWRLNMDYELPPYHLTYWTPASWTSFLHNYVGLEVLHCEASIYYGYVSDVLLTRFDLSRLARSFMTRFLFPCEVRFEKRFGMGASFYFEARNNTSHAQNRPINLPHSVSVSMNDVRKTVAP